MSILFKYNACIQKYGKINDGVFIVNTLLPLIKKYVQSYFSSFFLVERVGCYNDFGYLNGKRPFSKTKNFRPDIVWSNYMTSLQEIVMKCASFARKHNHKVCMHRSRRYTMELSVIIFFLIQQRSPFPLLNIYFYIGNYTIKSLFAKARGKKNKGQTISFC